MSSYHHLIVSQIDHDRQRLAKARISAGSKYEIATDAVDRQVAALQAERVGKIWGRIRHFFAKRYYAVASIARSHVLSER